MTDQPEPRPPSEAALAPLRDQVAAALYERERPPRDPHWPDVYPADREVFEAMADVVLPVVRWREQQLIDAHKATIGELRRAEALLRRYRDWLAEQHARAVRADEAGGVPAELRISPHSGIAAGLHTALLGLDRILEPPTQNAGPSITECAEADARWWNGEKVGE
jgi:hypothetical protein